MEDEKEQRRYYLEVEFTTSEEFTESEKDELKNCWRNFLTNELIGKLPNVSGATTTLEVIIPETALESSPQIKRLWKWRLFSGSQGVVVKGGALPNEG